MTIIPVQALFIIFIAKRQYPRMAIKNISAIAGASITAGT